MKPSQREFPALRLGGSPLAFVLAQVRFSPILEMGEYVAPIQKALRDQTFTRFKEEQVQEIVLGPEPLAKPVRNVRWIFGSSDQRSAVVLSNNFVLYETGAYDVFDSFFTTLASVLRAVRTPHM
jgi:uncharacterized protein (TIGR04255 family)